MANVQACAQTCVQTCGQTCGQASEQACAQTCVHMFESQNVGKARRQGTRHNRAGSPQCTWPYLEERVAAEERLLLLLVDREQLDLLGLRRVDHEHAARELGTVPRQEPK